MEEKCRKVLGLAFLCLAAQWTSLAQAACSKEANKTHPLRFWIDEYAFSSGETTILREELEEVGSGVAVLVGETRSSFLSVKGYYAPEQWDIYWTGRQGCLQALPHAMPGHKISCVPGLHELTMKDRLVARLTQFYGNGAFSIIPRSYLLPTQYWQWRMWLAAEEAEEKGEMWVLKEERHRGKGVHVMPLNEAVQESKVRKPNRNFDLVQAYVGDQMTVLGRKFYVRLWAVVTSSLPLRAYLFDGGVVVFGNATPEDKKLMTSDDFIVNLWHLGRTTEAAPWSMADFRGYLDNLTGSRAKFDSLWREMQRSLGLTFAAGVQSMRFSAASFPVAAAGATFELVGIDFLVDQSMKPWLLEVNAVPSLARKVINCEKQPQGCTQDGESESVFDIEKEKLVHSLFRLLQSTAGTCLRGNETHNESAATAPSLASFLARWRSNATDLAAMNKTKATSRDRILSDLGWKTKVLEESRREEEESTSGRHLNNSGRELRAAQDESAPADELPAEGSREPDSSTLPSSKGVSSESRSIHNLARARSVADASNLNKYVPEGQRSTLKPNTAPSEEEDQKLLEEHLLEISIKEVQVALANRFLPLMMVPEAADFSAQHQTRGAVFPQPAHKAQKKAANKHPGNLWEVLLLPFSPVVSAYGGLAGILEHLRLGIVLVMPEINNDVTMGIAGLIPGADWLILKGYQIFGWGDRIGTVEAMSVLPKHKLDQQLADYIQTTPTPL